MLPTLAGANVFGRSSVSRDVRGFPALARQESETTRGDVETIELVQELVERARDSQPDAWESIYRRIYPGLLAYARRRLPSREQADDAVSETMLRAFHGISRFAWRDGGFDAWLFGICRNVVLESQRARMRYADVPVPDSVDSRPGPLDVVVADEEAAGVRAAFARLSPDDQEVLELRVIGGLDAKAVAAVLGKRPGAVRMAQSRALVKLRAHMQETVAVPRRPVARTVPV